MGASSATRVLAVACMKIANDVRLLASGPRCGHGELSLPANEAGSSIMPGKVNPTQCEALTMVAARVMGNDVGIGIAAASGHLQLNVFKPILIHDLLESIDLLADACDSFRENCVVGIEPNRDTIARHVGNSLMLVTALAPLTGYDRSAKIARSALEQNVSLREAAVASGLVTAEQFDAHVRPAEMLRPREPGAREGPHPLERGAGVERPNGREIRRLAGVRRRRGRRAPRTDLVGRKGGEKYFVAELWGEGSGLGPCRRGQNVERATSLQRHWIDGSVRAAAGAAPPMRDMSRQLLGGQAAVGGARGLRRAPRSLATEAGSVKTARTVSLPPHRTQTRRSTSKVRFNKVRQSIREVVA